MPSVRTNPDDLLKVANAISAADQDIKAAIQKMQSALNAADWNDPVRVRFDKDFTSLMASLKMFQTNVPATVQHLKLKSNQLKTFLS